MEFEDVLKQVGDFGKFQKCLVYLFLVPASALNIIYDYMFMLTTPEHWCYVPQLANHSADVQKQLIRPMTIEQGLPSYDKCRMFDLNYDLLVNETTLPFNDTSIFKTLPCSNGWVYEKTIFEATATTQFDLVCDSAQYVSVVMSLGPIGLVFATPIFSAITDWIGRKKAFLYVNIGFALSLVSPIILRDFISFSICRLISGSLLVIYYQIPFILAMEFVGTDHRSRTSSLSAIGYSLGGCILPGIAYITGHWVWLAITQLAITIPVFILWNFLPESASWLITQKRYAEAYDVLKRVAKVNGKKAPDDLMIQIHKVSAKHEEKKLSDRKDSTWDLFRVPELRRQTLILTLLFISNVIAYAGLALNTLNFHGNEFLNYFLLSLADIPAMTLGWYLIEGRLGRRWTNTLALLLCGVCLCVPILLDPSQTKLITIMSLLGKGGTATSYMIIFQQAAEIFPTTLRSEGMGFCCTIGSFVAIFVPFISYLGRYGLWIPMFIMGSSCLVAGIASSFLPETLNENLPQNVTDSQKFGKNKKYLSFASVITVTHL